MPVWALIERRTGRIRLRLTGSCVHLVLARVRRGSVIQLAAIALVAAVVATAVALFIPWLPVAAGEEADRIHFVYWFATAICIGVFAVVAAVLVYSIWNFRVKPDDFSDGPPTHGHTPARDRLDGDPGHPRDGDLDRQRDRARPERQRRRQPARRQGRGAAVRLDVHVPEREDLRVPDASRRAGTEARHHGERRHPLVLGARSSRRSRTPSRASTTTCDHARRGTGTFPVICTELCGLGHAVDAEPRRDHSAAGVRRLVEGAAGQAAGGGGAAGSRSSSRTAAAAATRSSRCRRERQGRPRARQADGS